LCCQPCALRGDPAPLLGALPLPDRAAVASALFGFAVAGASTVTAGPPRVAIFVVAPMRFGAGGTIADSGTTGAAAVATDGAACSTAGAACSTAATLTSSAGAGVTV